MIQQHQTLISARDEETKLEVDTGLEGRVLLSIQFMTDPPEEVELTPEQVEKIVQQLGAWLGERAL